LITFDDGFLSNRIVAEKVLNPLGIKAIFFCISDFIDIHDNEEAKTFIKDRICLGWSVEKLPIHWKNMNWDDLSALVEQGHTIGAHTKSHARLSTILNTEELKSEIVYSADLIEKKLGISIDHFAYTFGDIDSISKEAIDIAKTRFKYIYSGLRGRNKGRNYGIFRDAAADQDNNMNYYLYSNSLLGSFLEGALDIYYASKRKKLESWYLNK
jgi:peptidoglycan/xylan/chitin deacetylase (PgdA/CDA1 family)